jgi:hypothetical protein
LQQAHALPAHRDGLVRADPFHLVGGHIDGGVRTDIVDTVPEVQADTVGAREAVLQEDCRFFSFQSERSIQCFYYLRFMHEDPLRRDAEFLSTHAVYLETYGTADQLSIDMLETLDLWAV